MKSKSQYFYCKINIAIFYKLYAKIRLIDAYQDSSGELVYKKSSWTADDITFAVFLANKMCTPYNPWTPWSTRKKPPSRKKTVFLPKTTKQLPIYEKPKNGLLHKFLKIILGVSYCQNILFLNN